MKENILKESNRSKRPSNWTLSSLTICVVFALLVFAFFDVAKDHNKNILLSTISGALAVIASIVVTVLLILSQLYSPYYSGVRTKTIITKTTLVYLCALAIGILLPLVILLGWRKVNISEANVHFLCFFQFSWAHLCLIWFACCIIFLPCYLQHINRFFGPRGIIFTAEAILLHTPHHITSTQEILNSFVEDHFKPQLAILSHIGVTAVSHNEIAVLQQVFDSLCSVLIYVDAKVQSDKALKGRIDVMLQRHGILPLPEYQHDCWRLVFRELNILHICLRNSAHLMLEECRLLGTMGKRAIEAQNSCMTCIAAVSLLTQILDQSIVTKDPDVEILAVTEIERLAQEAIRAAIPISDRSISQRDYLYTTGNLAIRGIMNVFAPKYREPLLQQIPHTQTWNRAIRRAVKSIHNIGYTFATSISAINKIENLQTLGEAAKVGISSQDDLGKNRPMGIAREAISALWIMQKQFDKYNWHELSSEASSCISHLGLISIRLGWKPAANLALSNQKEVSLKLLDAKDISNESISISSIKNMGITAALENRDIVFVLIALKALVLIARNALSKAKKEELALNIIGGRNGVVTILGICRHTLDKINMADTADIEKDLVWIRDNSTSDSQLQIKANQALYEINKWFA